MPTTVRVQGIGPGISTGLRYKIKSSVADLPGPEIIKQRGSKTGLIAFGSTDTAVREALDYLKEEGIKLNYLRLKSLPVGSQVIDFIKSQEKVYVIENNRDGQMHKILSLEVPEKATDLVSLAFIDGLPLSAEWITGAVLDEENS